jgi:hypothetical protein
MYRVFVYGVEHSECARMYDTVADVRRKGRMSVWIWVGGGGPEKRALDPVPLVNRPTENPGEHRRTACWYSVCLSARGVGVRAAW